MGPFTVIANDVSEHLTAHSPEISVQHDMTCQTKVPEVNQAPVEICFSRVESLTSDLSYVITELLQSDLHKIIVSPQHLSADHIKVFLYQILRGK